MRIKYIISGFLLFICFHCAGKTSVFEKFDFSKGGFYLLGTPSGSDRSSLADSIGRDFYIDDIECLNQMKKDWTFSKPGMHYACGYHYIINICKDGKVLDNLVINLNCNELVWNEKYFYFDNDKIRRYMKNMKKPVFEFKKFSTISEGRKYADSIDKAKGLVMRTTSENWSSYEGKFQFTYKCTLMTKDCFGKWDKVKEMARKEIIKKYPGESFSISSFGGSTNEVFLAVECNKSLNDKFDLYPRFGEWNPFTAFLEVYWVRKE